MFFYFFLYFAALEYKDILIMIAHPENSNSLLNSAFAYSGLQTVLNIPSKLQSGHLQIYGECAISY